jgi:hypothetical protein
MCSPVNAPPIVSAARRLVIELDLMSASEFERLRQRNRIVPALRKRLGPLTLTLESVNYDKWPSRIQASKKGRLTRS